MKAEDVRVVPLVNGREYIGIVNESSRENIIKVENAHVLVKQRTGSGEIEVGLAPGRVYGTEDTIEIYKEFVIERPYKPNEELLKSYLNLISASEIGIHLPPQKSIVTP
jgi:hypothetical protein